MPTVESGESVSLHLEVGGNVAARHDDGAVAQQAGDRLQVGAFASEPTREGNA